MGFAHFSFRRFFVLALSIALIVISAISLSAGGSTAHIIVNAVVLACSVLGLLGVIMGHPGWLQLFLLVEVALCIWELVYIIVAAVDGTSLSDLTYDIILCVLLGVGALFTTDLIRYESGAGIAGPAMSGPVIV